MRPEHQITNTAALSQLGSFPHRRPIRKLMDGAPGKNSLAVSVTVGVIALLEPEEEGWQHWLSGPRRQGGERALVGGRQSAQRGTRDEARGGQCKSSLSAFAWLIREETSGSQARRKAQWLGRRGQRRRRESKQETGVQCRCRQPRDGEVRRCKVERLKTGPFDKDEDEERWMKDGVNGAKVLAKV